MLRRLDKIRFRGQKREEFLDPTESPNTSDTECSDEVVVKTRCLPKEQEEPREPELEQQMEAQAGPGSFLAGVQEEPKTDLNEVKGLLEIALLEKHFLKEELRKLKDESHIESLKQELEKERCKRIELEQKVNDAIKLGVEDSPSQSRKSPSPQPSLSSSTEKHKQTLWNNFLKWLYNRFGVYIEDFRFQPEETTVETEEPLSGKRLTENMRRLKRGFRPVTNFMRNLSALSSWYSVYTSAIAFIVYMYAAWHGWAIPMFLFLAILRLSLNYFISRGWRIQWSIVPEVSEPLEPPKEDLTVSEKFQLVLDVAQKAQNLFGRMANILEKIKNLFMWVQPELTQKLYVGLWAAFISSCLLPYQLLGFIISVYLGIKFFIVDFILKSCPKLRQRFDTPYIIWTNLPNDLQLKERNNTTLSRRVAPAGGRGSVGSAAPLGASREEECGRYYSTKRGAFHEVFSLPESERPLSVCENGWRCCLINRDRKTPTDYIRHGVLYVTENHLCFESSSSRSGSSKRNKVIKLTDIIEIQKYKVLSVLPGSGMGISIATPTTQKPLVFGAMMHRDEAFDAIFSQHSKMVEKARAKNPET
ncbi:GRAM domain-containing protein 4-like [Gambusia affinis]|uniref:GRAM domain-containing protein 4-like n=1 Tax=Gambusia affinis TaxID=33528 RepID=UPI001CDC8C85|nr:GRAM domain-containing protein 4-like [Gambusia affinis]XP_043979957.1 GRAM domain-containing protein 4-like [Gambusia affinis]XP_043979958.1 GRAM domain-containing protein 4-like [Gambusia affinis]XP_043979959.1 GRAM domain-containing protein 4-like [Gambusia affinis]XP_043979961.1 GRAM domain-containing protein 4-like [Gambusia affinis]